MKKFTLILVVMIIVSLAAPANIEAGGFKVLKDKIKNTTAKAHTKVAPKRDNSKYRLLYVGTNNNVDYAVSFFPRRYDHMIKIEFANDGISYEKINFSLILTKIKKNYENIIVDDFINTEEGKTTVVYLKTF